MPSSSLVHVAVFTVGAIVGGGLVTAVGASRQQRKFPPKPLPIVDVKVETSGETRVAPTGVAGVVTPLPAILKYGFPGPIADQLVRTAYVAGYDRRLRHPAWTAEHLTLAKLGKSLLEPPPENEKGNRAGSTFTEDESLPTVFRAKLQDYFRSGYDRGHMVPAADATMSQEAMNETFLLSNIAPQVGDGFNRHYWAYLEAWCRKLTSSFSDVYVFTVPLYLPRLDPDGKWRVTHEVIGNPPNVSVPTHFAKVVLTSRPSSPLTPNIPDISTGAFVLPNAIIKDDTPLESFVVPVEAVERAAGLTLFSDEIKKASKHICQTVSCEVVVRRFDEARKRPDMRRTVSAPAKS